MPIPILMLSMSAFFAVELVSINMNLWVENHFDRGVNLA